MKHSFLRCLIFCGFLIPASMVQAVDSYRYAHVTIDTPWMIFLFLLVIIMIPFVLMAVLHWHFAIKKSKEEADSEQREKRDEI